MRLRRFLPLFLVVFLPMAPALEAPPAEEDANGYVVACYITGEIDEGISAYVDRVVEHTSYAKAVIFLIDTPGGRVDSALEITNAILRAGNHTKTIAYVVSESEGMGAISAGAIISFACQHIVMQPGTNMGGAAPVMVGPQGALPTGEKEVSVLRSKMRALAEKNGHNPDIGEAMVDRDVELRLYKEDGKNVVRAVRSGSGRTAASPGSPAEALEEVVDRLFDVVGDEVPVPVDGLRDAARDAARRAGEAMSPPAPDSGAPAEDGELVLPRGKLLTLTANEAHRYGVIPTTCNNLDEVLSFYELHEANLYIIEMTWSEKVFRWLTSPMVSGLLLLLGVGGMYFEIRTPGFGAPGIIGVICLTLFFGSRAILGLAGWIDIALVLVGVVLIAIEIFVIPGFGIVGALGILSLVLGIILSFTLKGFEWPRYSWDYDRLQDAAQALGIAMGSFIALVVVTWKLFPHTPMYRWLVLVDTQDTGAGYVVQTSEQCDNAVGLRGRAVSMLRPAGRGRFGDKTYQVVSRGEFIEPGRSIVITQVDGNRYVVEEIADDAPGAREKV